MQAKTTLSEMSKALNLSVSTISKSLSDSTEISEPTKKRVQDFAKKCNYVPNSFAANFRKGNTNTIGLVIPSILNPFYAKVLLGIENYLEKKGYKLITSISNEVYSKEANSINNMAGGYIDGLIICVSKETQLKNKYNHIKALIKQGTPVVLFDRICEALDCDKVVIDDYKTAFDTTEHLIKTKDCDSILMVSMINDLKHGKLRAKGYIDAMKAYGKNANSKIIAGDSIENLRKEIDKILISDKKIDAIFGVNEQAVLQAMHATRQLNNDKIIIAGFCNDWQADYDSSLVIVNQNAEKIGKQTAKLILERVKTTETKVPFTKKINTFLS